ncbi:MAG TPA: VOC family protein [Protaetiibacter sp.]|nr:VOC family protein [Protaetiibacter sp.]
MPSQLNRIIVSVRNLHESLAFYAELLHLELVETRPGFATLAAGGDVQLGLHERDSEPSDRAVALSFAVDDLDRVCSGWESADGSVVDRPADQPWGERMAMVRDPDGHLVCLVQQHA